MGPVTEQAGSSDTKKGADGLGEREREITKVRGRESERLQGTILRETRLSRSDVCGVSRLSVY